MSTAGEVHLPVIPLPGDQPPRTGLGRWLQHGGRMDQPHGHGKGAAWYWVLWLTGVDYFSTLGYQPGIALLAAGALAPSATLLLVLVTLFGALPIYREVAARSFAGQGSIAMLERLLTGWKSKLFVLVLLGFACTDFIITMTLSAADASTHAVENPILHPYLEGHELGLTLVLLALLAGVFLKGFHEAIGLASAVAIPYMLLNLVVIGRGALEIARRPELLETWRLDLQAHGDWTTLFIASAFVFPKLALGMSGFETGVSVMPQVKGDPGDIAGAMPVGRVRHTRHLLAAAAVIMGSYLLASSVVTTVLIPESAYAEGGDASGRALAWLAHGLLGHGFGTVYDLSTMLILWFAGASAMAGLLNIIPRYMPRFGMAPQWILYSRPLVLLLFAVTVLVTIIFDADVEAQAGAYATGVLVLMLSAAIAVALAIGHDTRGTTGRDRVMGGAKAVYFWVVAAVFAFTLVDNVYMRADGVIISAVFCFVILTVGGLSRAWRSTELRVTDLVFEDRLSAQIWEEIRPKKVNLVPLRTASRQARAKKGGEIRQHYKMDGPLAFLHVDLLDNRSEFLAPLRVKVRHDGYDFVIEVSGAVAIANTIAYMSELLDPLSLSLGLTRQDLMLQSLKYLLWGEGETGLMVYLILQRYWEWTPGDDVRPVIFLMSD